MKRKMCQSSARNVSEEPVPDKEVWSFLASALDKKRAAKRKRPDMYREALLQRTVQRLNDEITERCMKRTKKRKGEEKYDWKDGPDGWCMTSSYQDDEEYDALLGINSFFSELSKLKPNKRKRDDDANDGNKSTTLPSFSETFGKRRTKNIGSESIDDGTTTAKRTNMATMASCRAVTFQPQMALVEQFDSLCC